MKKLFWILTTLYCGSTNILYAATSQHGVINYSMGLGAPIVTSTTDTLDKGSWSGNQRTEYYRFNTLSDATLLEFPLAESQKSLLINYFMLGYGLTNDFTVSVNLPVQRTYNLRAVNEIDDDDSFVVADLGNISGLSDATVFGLWRTAKGDSKRFPLSMALLFGINMPTGKTTAKTKDGELFSASDQPGTGAWVPVGGIIFSKKWHDLTLSSNFIYTQMTKGTQDTILGSYFDYNFALDYPLFEHEGKHNYNFEGILEIAGEYVAKDKIHSIKDPNSGGNSIYLNPGFRANIEDNISCYLSIGIPVSERLNGTQVTSKYAIYTGIDLSF
ncbi:hypothetical protein [Legionella cardiaca]|uniref:Transporter n=1 Tax=Legionella cardiaca TaxID=1071983 RepID=A0ABY8ASX3_9GAMM|nr:hypothetical protein [Legionella cardiaca]WED43643.1 hypothetical protein PXX05_02380 [Legionella cardiaca]